MNAVWANDIISHMKITNLLVALTVVAFAASVRAATAIVVPDSVDTIKVAAFDLVKLTVDR